MKVLQINTVYNIASTGRTTTELHRYLLNHGHQSLVAAVNVENTESTFRLGNRIENSIHSFFSHLTGRQGSYSTKTTKRLLEFIRKKNPDVVHLRVLHSNCINIFQLLQFLGDNNYPVVLTLHDCWYFTGHCCYFTGASCEKWKFGCGKCPEIHRWNKSWFLDRSKENLALKKQKFDGIKKLAVIGVSDWVTNFVSDSILQNAKIVKRIYNWIDLETFKPLETSFTKKKLGVGNSFTIICIAQHWSLLKGLDDILKLATRMADCKFLLVGKCPQEYFPLPQNVVYVNCTKNVQELAAYYSAADVFFNPSLQETFGKVTAEALSCGTPVVAYGVTATVELVKPGCGYLIAPHDLDAAVEKIQLIRENGKKVYIENCRNFAVNNFDKELLMQDTLRLYTDLINS